HHVTLRNLEPETQYSFRIAGKVNGKMPPVFTAITTSIEEDLFTPNPAYGKVEGVNNSDTVVILVPRGINQRIESLMSTTVNAQGTYSFDLNYFSVDKINASRLSLAVRDGKTVYEPYQFSKATYKPLETISFEQE